MERFKETVELRDGSYYVELPWHQYRLVRGPSYHATSLMEDRFHMDNLVASVADPSELAKLYSLVREHLREGGFVIQSCNSNCQALRTKLEECL